MKFVLFEKLAELTPTQWLFIAGAVAVIAVAAVLLYKRRHGSGGETAAQKPRPNSRGKLRELIIGALCLALSFVLSYIKLFSMPMGGSVTLASMLPLCWYANRYGLKAGLIAGLGYGLLQFIQKPEVFHWAQVILEYPLAFMCLGLAAGVKNLQLGIVIAGVGRALCHIAAGGIFFGSWAPAGMNPWIYSLSYNGAYLGIDILICILLSFPLAELIRRNKLDSIT